MRKTCCLLAQLLSLFFYNGAPAEDIPFAIGEWVPYTGEDTAGHGLAAEIVSAACNATSLKAVYNFFPWKRAEYLVARGSSFGTFPYQEIPERRTTYVFSKTLFSSSFVILAARKNTKAATLQYNKPEDLQGFVVGIIAGTDAIKNSLETAGVSVQQVATSEQNLKKLEIGRIDFYIDDKAVIVQNLKTFFGSGHTEKFAFLENSYSEDNDFKIMISRKYEGSSRILLKINEGLDKINTSGELQAILQKHNL